jgi:hypothetical protein
MGSIFSCPLFLCERFFLGTQKEMRISNDEYGYMMNDQVVITMKKSLFLQYEQTLLKAVIACLLWESKFNRTLVGH